MHVNIVNNYYKPGPATPKTVLYAIVLPLLECVLRNIVPKQMVSPMFGNLWNMYGGNSMWTVM